MVGAIILAGGQGSRFKGKKQFISLNGKELWRHVFDKVKNVIENENIIVVGVDVDGGKTRSESVRIGLQSLSEHCDRVVILEAARPLVTVEQIEQLATSENASVTFAMPLVNTVIGRDGTYFNRNDFYDLLTPQAFDYQMLKKAYESGKYIDTTDETVVMFEEYGIKPTFIVDGENLIKVTYKRDLKIVSELMKEMNG